MRAKVTLACSAILLCLSLGIHAATVSRESLYEQFGPKLLEAVCLVMKDEINVLRQQNGLAPRTDQQLVQAVQAKLETLSDYAWMADQ